MNLIQSAFLSLTCTCLQLKLQVKLKLASFAQLLHNTGQEGTCNNSNNNTWASTRTLVDIAFGVRKRRKKASWRAGVLNYPLQTVGHEERRDKFLLLYFRLVLFLYPWRDGFSLCVQVFRVCHRARQINGNLTSHNYPLSLSLSLSLMWVNEESGYKVINGMCQVWPSEGKQSKRLFCKSWEWTDIHWHQL